MNGDEKKMNVETLKLEITKLLQSTKRENIDKMIGYLEKEGFFESPASTRFHGCYTGGLAQHSLNVYKNLSYLNKSLRLNTPEESIIIATLLHDVCKIGAYIGEEIPYSWNRQQPKGHATLSLERIQKIIKLTELEEKMILYHMGIYGLVEFQDPGRESKGEYTLRNKGMVNAWLCR